ncbi:MAG TPA: ADP-ribosylglycohydrolase family protein [Pyrinomonadaceae bacterium]|nr:ADP-ribosylglycohydrolase family protein [Pyrinomonadaceae bacterium]
MDQITRAAISLKGLAVGDCFGETFFINPDLVESLIEQRALREGRWHYTDDTNMALSIFSILRQYGRIDQNALAKSFALRYDSGRGYGPAMHRLLADINSGGDWSECAQQLFEGQGSFGNGAAMRVGPVGAFFADDIPRVIEEARRSAVITHAHDEAIAGAIAVAVATAQATQLRDTNGKPERADFLDFVFSYLPDSEVRSKVRQARDMSDTASVAFAVSVLGNGVGVSAQDTVPFALWCASQHLNDYAEALWLTVSGLGDRDTTCAIVGGIVVMMTGVENIPSDWLQFSEPLPDWPFSENS